MQKALETKYDRSKEIARLPLNMIVIALKQDGGSREVDWLGFPGLCGRHNVNI